MNWNNIKIAELEQAIIANIDTYKKIIEQVANNKDLLLNWQNLIQPLEDARANLDEKVNIVAHLHSVQDNLELRKVYSNILPMLSDLSAEFLQNSRLQQKVLQLKESTVFAEFNIAQQKVIENLLLDFKLAGVNLSIEQQAKYKQITKQLSELSDQFSKNVLDATHNWHYYITSVEYSKLDGLPQHVIALAKQAAEKQEYNNGGWVLTLDFPCVDAVLRYATNRELRKIIYTANITKASEITKQFDNSEIMQTIVNLRLELANLLEFKNYSEYSLAHKMAKTTKEVINFLEELADVAVPIAKKEFLALQQFVKRRDNFEELEPWDVTFYSEQYKKVLFDLSDEELRNYFQISKVLLGMFKLANNLFGINVEEVVNFDKWDGEVKFYKVFDNENNLRGFFYIDLYIRDNKKSGAWMAECLARHKRDNGELQIPVAFLVTNFAKGTLLYHEELLTLLHEFGHVLHHILTKVDYINVSGCNGVSWDAVELPSQFMEKWGYDWQFLQDVAEHYQTKEPLSKEIFDSLINIKNYNAGMSLVRQLEFATFDFKLHMYKPAVEANAISVQDIQNILNKVRDKVTVIPVADFNRFQHGFSHIFAGGYAAGYYSYSWAEVLAADAFMAFKDDDLRTLGTKFLNNILEMGGSKDAMELYIAFRGTKPEVQALLEYKGLLKKV
ncbi:MAG: M3 family metallopeptidase [Gammaproteobacteria bacterium]